MITPAQAADVINYLYAAQAITVTDNQDAVWADFINAEIPELKPADLLPAARKAIKLWADQGRSWRIDVARYVKAAQAIRRERIDRVGTDLERPRGVTPEQDIIWQREVYRLLGDGLSKGEAQRLANQRIGYTPPPVIDAAPRGSLRELVAQFQNQTQLPKAE